MAPIDVDVVILAGKGFGMDAFPEGGEKEI